MRTRCLSLFLLCSLSLSRIAFADENPLIRIGLTRYFPHPSTIYLYSDQPFSFVDAQTGKRIADGTPRVIYEFSMGAKGIALASVSAAADEHSKPLGVRLSIAAAPAGPLPLHIADSENAAQKTAAWHGYHGTLTFCTTPNRTLRIIDSLPLETYLYGVLPAEIGAQAPPEALKAQAVAARTYALKNLNRFALEGFDLDDTTQSEGYIGADGETPVTKAAVDSTRSLVLTYGGELIDAPYSTDCGGVTACDPTGKRPYLLAIRDSPGDNQPDYAADSKYHHWSQTLTKAQLQTLLACDPRTQTPQFLSLSIDGYDSSGRITTATVADVDGAMKTVTGPQLRQIIGYDVLRSTRIKLKIAANGDYVFEGWGWGHGLGMSQLGAVAMASPPYHRTYAEILSHYYVGAKIAPFHRIKSIKTALSGF